MSSETLSELTSGVPALTGDLIPIDRVGANYAVTAQSIANLASASNVILSASVTLTASQVNALKTTPIQVVAAPGAGIFINVIQSVWNLTRSSSFSGGSTNYAVGFSISTAAFYETEIDPSLITSSSSQVATISYSYFRANTGSVGFPVTTANSANKALFVLNRGAADSTGGSGSTLTVTVFYTLVTVS